jgi:hypothetical protein
MSSPDRRTLLHKNKQGTSVKALVSSGAADPASNAGNWSCKPPGGPARLAAR